MLAIGAALVLTGCASSAAQRPVPHAPAPIPTTTATTSFDAGAPFQQDCTIAAGSTPFVSDDRVQVWLSCPGVPSNRYLRVLATYGDTDAEFTPSEPVHVTGTVSSTAISANGASYLIVAAQSIR